MVRRSVCEVLLVGRRAVVVGVVGVSGLLGMGCSGEDLVLPEERAPAQLVADGGDAQVGAPGQALADSIVVRVTDAADRPVAGQGVVFQPLGGAGVGGDVSPDTAFTDDDGRAAARWVLAADVGRQFVRAEAAGNGTPEELAVTFTAMADTADAPPPPPPSGTRGTSVTLVAAPEPSDVGRAVRFTFTVLPTVAGSGTPAGGVRVNASSGESCTGVTSRGVCEIVFNSPGDRTATATFLGSSTFSSSTSSPITHRVRDVEGATVTVMGTDPDPSREGESFRVFVHVRTSDGKAARGTITLYGAGTVACGAGEVLGEKQLNGQGDAEINVAALPKGLHVLRGCFEGRSGYAPSEDLATQTVE